LGGAISEYSRAHFLKLFPHFQRIVRVVYPAPADDSTLQGLPPAAAKHLGPGEFWLSVARSTAQNQRLLVQAHARYQRWWTRNPAGAGGKGWLMEDFQEYLANSVSDESS
jgi:hypothetical protein